MTQLVQDHFHEKDHPISLKHPAAKRPLAVLVPIHDLAGLIRCKNCDGIIVQISGKDGRYYGCYKAKRKSCNNKLWIPRKQIEIIILNDLAEKFLTVENLTYIYENVKKIIAKTLNEVLENLKQNRNQYDDRSYYVAHTSIQTLALLDEEPKNAN